MSTAPAYRPRSCASVASTSGSRADQRLGALAQAGQLLVEVGLGLSQLVERVGLGVEAAVGGGGQAQDLGQQPPALAFVGGGRLLVEQQAQPERLGHLGAGGGQRGVERGGRLRAVLVAGHGELPLARAQGVVELDQRGVGPVVERRRGHARVGVVGVERRRRRGAAAPCQPERRAHRR